jgi:hypothetical protein
MNNEQGQQTKRRPDGAAAAMQLLTAARAQLQPSEVKIGLNIRKKS